MKILDRVVQEESSSTRSPSCGRRMLIFSGKAEFPDLSLMERLSARMTALFGMPRVFVMRSS